jgi:hypothetical protein
MSLAVSSKARVSREGVFVALLGIGLILRRRKVLFALIQALEQVGMRTHATMLLCSHVLMFSWKAPRMQACNNAGM